MTTSHVTTLPVGALVHNAKTWGHLLLIRNTETELVLAANGHAYAYLPPTLRQRALEFNVPKPLPQSNWAVDRIA